MSKKLPLLLISTIALILLIPAVSAEPGFHSYGENSVDLDAGRSYTFDWGFSNADDTMYLISVYAETSNPSICSVSYESNYVLSSGSGLEIPVNIYIDEGADTQTVHLSVQFTIEDLSQPGAELYVFSDTVQINVTSLFASVGNTIFGWENTLPAPFNSLLWTFILTLVIWVIIGLIVYFVLEPIFEKLTLKTKTKYDNIVFDILRTPIFVTIVLFGLVDSVDILSISNADHILIHKLVSVILILIYTLSTYRLYDKVFISFLKNYSSKKGSTLGSALAPILHLLGMILIPVAGITVLLSTFGIDITLILAGAGVGASIITLAAKDVFISFFAGLQVMLDRPFKIGDRVMLDSGEICDVRKIGVRSTQLYDIINHAIIILPNTMVAANKVVNYSEPDNHRAVSASIGVAYGTDVDKVTNLLLNVADKHPDIVHNNKDQAPYVRFADFGPNSLDFTLWFYVDDIRKMWRVISEVKEQINKCFEEEGIEIPFPQSVVTFNHSSDNTPTN